jgi:hypothetical protein
VKSGNRRQRECKEMFEFLTRLFDDGAEQKRKLAHELQVRQTLAEKVSQYRARPATDDTDFTEITLEGRKLRVAAEHIILGGSSRR